MKRGFTLIELLVVIVIIAILASGVFMMSRAGGDRAAIAKTTTKIQAIAGLLEVYKAQYGTYPRVRSGIITGGIKVRTPSGSLRNINSGDYCFNVDFSFIADLGDTNLNEGSEASFGLMSYFVPRVSIMESEMPEDSDMRPFYEEQLSSPSTNLWKMEYPGGWAVTGREKWTSWKEEESADPALQAVYREFRRLVADGVIMAGGSIDPETELHTYSAGARDDFTEYGRSLIYRMDGEFCEVFSLGPDGIACTDDDITTRGVGPAWTEEED